MYNVHKVLPDDKYGHDQLSANALVDFVTTVKAVMKHGSHGLFLPFPARAVV